MKKSFFNTAATCFREGGDFEMEKIAKCHQKALDASKMIESPGLMRELFLSAAHDFLECGHPLEAGKCLENAKELSLAADLYRKTNLVEKAADIYIKMQLPLKGSKCYEEAGQFKQAITLLIKYNLFEASIDCLHRYQILVQEYKDKNEPIPSRLIENAPEPNHSEQKLSIQAAGSFLKLGKTDKMMLALNRLPDVAHKLEFLTVNDCIQEAVKILQLEGTPRQLVDVYLNNGMTDEALRCAESLGDSDLRNKCHIVDSMIKLSKTRDGNDMDDTSKEKICKKLGQVFYAMHDSKEKALAGKAMFIVGKLNKDIQSIGQAYGAFDHCKPFPNIAGQLDCMDWMTLNASLKRHENLTKCILGMSTLFKALNILVQPINDSERTQLVDILEYYGFYRSTRNDIFLVYPRQKPVAAAFIQKQNRHVCNVKLSDACKWSFQFLAEKGLKWKLKLEQELNIKPEEYLIISLGTLIKRVQTGIRCIELEMHIRVGSMELEKRGSVFDKELGSLKAISYAFCERILKDIFHDDGTISFSTLSKEHMLQFCDFLKNPGKTFFHQNMKQYLQYLVQHHCPSWTKDDVPNFLWFLFIYDVFGERLQIRPADVLKDKDETSQTEECESIIKENMIECEFESTLNDDREQMLPVSLICAKMSECQELLKGLKLNAAVLEFGILCEKLSQCEMSLLPCLSPLLYWMEFYLTLFLFSSTMLLTTRNESNPNKIFLPMSYYRNTIAMSCVFTSCTDIITKIMKSSRDSRQHNQALLKFLQSIGKLLFGTSNKLNLFDVVFSREENKIINAQKNVFSERLLVLCLTVFCNLRRKVDKAAVIEKELAEQIWSLVSSQKRRNIPEEMKKRLTMTFPSKRHHLTPSDFQLMFHNFVNRSENDNLYCFKCRGADGTLHEEIFDLKNCKKAYFLNPDTSKVTQNVPLQNNKDQERERLIDKHKPFKAVIDPSVFHGKNGSENMLREETEIEQTFVQQQEYLSKEEKAIAIIVRALRTNVFRKKSVGMISKLKQLIITTKEEEIENEFSFQLHDKSMCGVCGIHYVTPSQVSKDSVIIYERQEKPFKEDMLVHSCEGLNDLDSSVQSFNDMHVDSCSTDNADPFRLLMKCSKNIEEVQETYEAHIANESHQAKLSQYDSFRCKVYAEIYDAVNDVERFIDIYGLSNERAAALYHDLYPNINLLCNSHRELVEYKKHIIKEKDWGNSEIDDKVRDLLEIFSLLKESVKHIAAKNKEEKKRSTVENAQKKSTKKTRPSFRNKPKFTFSSS